MRGTLSRFSVIRWRGGGLASVALVLLVQMSRAEQNQTTVAEKH